MHRSPKPGHQRTSCSLSGDAQGASKVGNKLQQPLSIEVSDSLGRRLAGVTVSWGTSSGSLSVASSVTDANGATRVEWTLGSLAGNQTAATVTGLKPITFQGHRDRGASHRYCCRETRWELLGIGDSFRLNARIADKFGNIVLLTTTVVSADTSIVNAYNFGCRCASSSPMPPDKTTTIRATSGSDTKKRGPGSLRRRPASPGFQPHSSSREVGEVALAPAAAMAEFCGHGTDRRGVHCGSVFSRLLRLRRCGFRYRRGEPQAIGECRRIRVSLLVLSKPTGLHPAEQGRGIRNCAQGAIANELTPLMSTLALQSTRTPGASTWRALTS